MAEVAASLIGIATFGVTLTTKLYEFGATASSAKEQTDFIARHVRMYGETLELLGHKIDEDQPIHSNKALDLVDEIEDQSYDLFDKVRDLLPDTNDRMTFMQKIKWNFRKTKVEVLVAEIEYLKSTVNLLVTVLYAGKRIRSHRRKRKHSKEARDDINIQCAKVKNAIIEQFDATTLKETLQAKVEDEEQDASASNSQQQIVSRASLVAPLLENSSALTVFKTSLGRPSNPSEERALVVQGSIDLLTELLGLWTTLADQPEISQNQSSTDSTRKASSKANLSKDERDEDPSQLNSSRGGAQNVQEGFQSEGVSPREQASRGRDDDSGREMLTKAYLEAREDQVRMAEELRKLRLEKLDLEERIKITQEFSQPNHTFAPREERLRHEGWTRDAKPRPAQSTETRIANPPFVENYGTTAQTRDSERVRDKERERDRDRRNIVPPNFARSSTKPLQKSVSRNEPSQKSGHDMTTPPEKSGPGKAEEPRTDQEKMRERTSKAKTSRGATLIAASLEDSEYEEIRPSSKPGSRSKAPPTHPKSSTPNPEKLRHDDDDDESLDARWEKHHNAVKEYISKATNRPSLDRSGSDAARYWENVATRPPPYPYVRADRGQSTPKPTNIHVPDSHDMRSPPVSRARPTVSPLRHTRSSDYDMRSDHPDLSRPSTKYASRSGEKTDLHRDDFYRSRSVRNSSAEPEWEDRGPFGRPSSGVNRSRSTYVDDSRGSESDSAESHFGLET